MKTFKNFISEAEFKLPFKSGLPAGAKEPIKPLPKYSGELSSGPSGGRLGWEAAKLKDKAETIARSSLPVDLIPGLRNPEKTEGLRKFNPGAAQTGDLLSIGSMATGLGSVKSVGAKVAERQSAKILGQFMKADQELGRSNLPRTDIHNKIKARYSDTPEGDLQLTRDLGNPKTKHTLWGLGQHMEHDPKLQSRIVDTLKRADPTDKRIQFTTDRMNVNKYIKQNFPDKFDDLRDPMKKYDPKEKSYRPRKETDPSPGYDPKLNDKGETVNAIDTAAKARARLRPGGADEDPYLRRAVAATRAKTQPSFSNRWDDVPQRSVVDKVVDKIIGAKYDKYGNYIGK